MASSTLIRATNLSVVMKEKTILKDISLRINTGDFITIVGPNGAGKSTLLKCLVGILQPTSGNITKQHPLSLGYIPQRLSINTSIPLTVKRFLTLNLSSTASLNDICQQTTIYDLLDRFVTDLSGGELQRVLLARALLKSPNILVLDEPAQNLDISGQLAFYKLLETIHQTSNIAIIMVSHDLHMVMSRTKHVVCLYHHICCSGEPQMVTKDPEFISLFGHDMAKMMAVYQHEHNHQHDDMVPCDDHTH